MDSPVQPSDSATNRGPDPGYVQIRLIRVDLCRFLLTPARLDKRGYVVLIGGYFSFDTILIKSLREFIGNL